MNERDYLDDAVVAGFVAFLCDMVVRGRPDLALRVGSGRGRRVVATLQEAVDLYSWRGDSFATTNAKADALRTEMQAALVGCDAAEGRVERRMAELELLFVSTKALSWGRVYEGAFPFLIHQAETGVLSCNLRRGAELLDGSEDELEVFDERPCRSDCGMTKVYSAINQRTVVYDDRLGAGLGLLCRHYLERAGAQRVPRLLAFMAGDAGEATRNPSRRSFLFVPKGVGREHARWNVRANWVIDRVAADPALALTLGGEQRDRIRRIEAALFTLGEDVADQPGSGVVPQARGPRRSVPVADAALRNGHNGHSDP